MAGAAGDVSATKAWLNKNQPKISTAGEADSAMVDSIHNSAKKHDITIVDQSFGEPVTQPNFQAISLKLKVSGSLQAVIRCCRVAATRQIPGDPGAFDEKRHRSLEDHLRAYGGPMFRP